MKVIELIKKGLSWYYAAVFALLKGHMPKKEYELRSKVDGEGVEVAETEQSAMTRLVFAIFGLAFIIAPFWWAIAGVSFVYVKVADLSTKGNISEAKQCLMGADAGECFYKQYSENFRGHLNKKFSRDEFKKHLVKEVNFCSKSKWESLKITCYIDFLEGTFKNKKGSGTFFRPHTLAHFLIDDLEEQILSNNYTNKPQVISDVKSHKEEVMKLVGEAKYDEAAAISFYRDPYHSRLFVDYESEEYQNLIKALKEYYWLDKYEVSKYVSHMHDAKNYLYSSKEKAMSTLQPNLCSLDRCKGVPDEMLEAGKVKIYEFIKSKEEFLKERYKI